MPQFQAMVSEANAQFRRGDPINRVDRTLFDQGRNLADSFRAMGIAADQSQRDFLDGLPAHVKEAVRAAIRAALQSDPRIEVQFLWMEAGHVDVRINSVPGTASSQGGIGILLQTPIPRAPGAQPAGGPVPPPNI
jgi:hypothetical protein